MLDSSRNAAPSDGDAVEHAAAVLRRGGVVVYPTETFYGLGVDTSNEEALRRLLELKERSADKPISVLVDGAGMLSRIARSLSPAAAILMRRFWPGPLTLVLPAPPSVSPCLTGGAGTIGVRWSSHATATALVKALHQPLTAPSANPAGAPPPITVEQARAYFGVAVGAYVDGGTLTGGAASTVVDPGPPLRVLRPGAISEEQLRAALSEES